MGVFVIPDNSPKGYRQNIPNDADDRKIDQPVNKFTSLTDHFDPKGQYTRDLYARSTHDRNALDEHIERLARLIEARGEYSLLVKRILDGTPCSCYDWVTKTPMRKYCLECYGTRIRGGYQLYQDSRRTDGKIIIAAPFSDATINWEDYGRDLEEENTWWTLPYIPLVNGSTTNSYDFIIRYNNDGTELGRYYVMNVRPSRSVENKITYQMFKARLADRPTDTYRGDILYEIDVNKLQKITGSGVQHGPNT